MQVVAAAGKRWDEASEGVRRELLADVDLLVREVCNCLRPSYNSSPSLGQY